MAEMTPMMQQYLQIKEQNKDCILFFRLGDFYEMFFDDAKIASKELELTLTGRDCGQKERAPMCGVPFHSYESYVARLVARGYKVAICEQTEDPAAAKGLVKRDIIRILTPGTVIEGSMLDESKNNYLAVLYASENGAEYGLCFCDCSTGDVHLTQLSGEDLPLRVSNELGRFSPSEILINRTAASCKPLQEFVDRRLNGKAEVRSDVEFDEVFAQNTILHHFTTDSLATLNLADKSAAVCALGCALRYLSATQMSGLERINNLDVYTDAQFMKLDITARRNLELVETMRSGEKRGSLLGVLDRTRTAMGKRLLRSWIEQPLVQLAPITRRLSAVDELVAHSMMRSDLQELLSEIYDLERIMTRVVYGSANARELRSLQQTLSYMPAVRQVLASASSAELSGIREAIDPLQDVCEQIAATIVDEPPFSVREGGMIRSGFNAELDELQSIMTDGKGILTRIEVEEKEKTGIKTLKVTIAFLAITSRFLVCIAIRCRSIIFASRPWPTPSVTSPRS